jgi:hypothetical protein
VTGGQHFPACAAQWTGGGDGVIWVLSNGGIVGRVPPQPLDRTTKLIVAGSLLLMRTIATISPTSSTSKLRCPSAAGRNTTHSISDRAAESSGHGTLLLAAATAIVVGNVTASGRLAPAAAGALPGRIVSVRCYTGTSARFG